MWLHREIQRKGPGDYYVVTPTFPLLQLKALPEFLQFFGSLFNLGTYTASPVKVFRFSEQGGRRMFADTEYEPGPVNVYFGHAQDPDSLESATAKAAWLDEAGQGKFKLDSWRAVLRRLSLALGRVLLTTTVYNLGWLKSQIWDRWKAGDPDYLVVNFESIANPLFPVEEWERAKRDLPRWKFDMMYRGLFTRPAGLIYDSFDEQRHKVPRFAIPEKWPRYLGLDFGGVNTAALFYAEEPGTDRLYLYREYKAGGRTAKVHAQKMLTGEPMIPTCVGGSKSEGQWRQEFRSGGLPVQEPPISDVEVGIDRVYGAHSRGEILVFDDLAGYLEEKLTYSRKLDENGEPTEVIEDKNSFHFCFVAGTQVDTPHGSVPIETLRPGDEVQTRFGPRRVYANLSRDREVVTVEMDNGALLTGTGDHPVLTANRGWAQMDAVRYDDILCTWNLQPEKPSLTRESRTIATPTVAVPLMSGILSAAAFIFTGLCGRQRSGRYPKATISTTATKILATIGSKTLSACQESNILAATISGRPQKRPMSNVFDPSRRNGTAPKRGASGIANTRSGSTSGERKILPSTPASNAAKCFIPYLAGGIYSALTTVRVRGGERLASMTKRAGVNLAASRSSATNTVKSGTATARVLARRGAGTRRVYNLSVEDVHEYIANGVVVSNCDAERYLLAKLRHTTGATLAMV